MAKEKKERIILWTPPGMFSFPYFVTPDSGRQYSDDKFKSDLLIPKAVFKEKGKALTDAVIQVGRDHFGSKFEIKSGKWKHPFKDTDKDEKITIDRMKGCILIRAKTDNRPLFIGPRKGPDGKFKDLTEEQIKAIVGGWWGALNVSVFPYDQQGGGVTFGLQAVQLWKEDEPFGQGRAKSLETAEELDVEVDDPDDGEEVDTSLAEEADSVFG